MMLGGAAAFGLAGCVPIDTSPAGRLAARLRILEAASGGTLGVAFLDTGSGEMIGHNRAMRFGHASSFKLSLAALVLWRDQQGIEEAERQVTWAEDELMSVSPFATERLAQGATLLELAEATQKFSDNAAANILLREIGGPERLNEFWRAIGDSQSRLDRIEPQLNHVPAGEVRDTTTPEAMCRTVEALCFGDVLQAAQRALLRQWMIDTRTGLRRVRAGIPQDWRAGDKTGTSTWPGMGSLYVDIGFVAPADRAPLTFATYFRAGAAHERVEPAAEAVLAQVGRVLADFAAG
ncbi:class A beta-lactamase [Altererythrobacter sp. BO-6]|nr:class A beta-lactamase [Altererythrobacter sp. BO-6]